VIEVAVYIVREGKVILFPDATVAKMGADGKKIHVIRNDVIIGNFPAYNIAYYGIELPPHYQKAYESQLAWEAMTPEERGRISAEAQARRKGLTPPAEQEGEKSE
jgi:hypothetical protein